MVPLGLYLSVSKSFIKSRKLTITAIKIKANTNKNPNITFF